MRPTQRSISSAGSTRWSADGTIAWSACAIDSAARRVLPLLPEFPVVSSDIVAGALDISERSGRTALGVLAEHGIVIPLGRRSHPGRPRRWWVAHELVDLVTSWSR